MTIQSDSTRCDRHRRRGGNAPPRRCRRRQGRNLHRAAPKIEYAIKKLPFDPAKVKGLSEKLLVSHYENNYSGAVKRLNAITAQLAASTSPARRSSWSTG